MISESASPQQSPRCKACDHPRPACTGGYCSLRSSLSTMVARGRDGCVTCLVLSNGIQEFLKHDEKGRTEAVDEVQINFNLVGSRRSLEVSLLGTDTNISFFVESKPLIGDTFPDIPIGNELPSTTSSDTSLRWAIDQLQHCKENHKICYPYPYNQRAPTRLLDVSNERIRLYEPPQSDRTPYVALSHCWGQTPFLRTLTTNIDVHKDDIPRSFLPPTFRDAVRFTRKLNIRYLWIDSLCIIQDDPLDWECEASRMYDLYRGAFLVLSASHSNNAYGGLFTSFSSTHKSYTVPAPPPLEGLIFVRRMLTHPLRSISPYHQSREAPLPAFTRGWIFQERLLSARTLHFNPHELFWECRQSNACQCTPSSSSIPPALLDHRTTSLERNTQLLARSSFPKGLHSTESYGWYMTPSEKTTSWHHLVEDYTKLQLSYEKDILPALGGLAWHFGCSGPPSQYLAGLWRNTLHRDLLWHTPTLGVNDKEAKRKQRRPTRWRAPSWSWASVLGPVEYLNTAEGVEEVCEIQDAQIKLAGMDPRGELASCELLVTGTVIKCEMKMTENARGAWDAVQLDVLDRGYVKNLWMDDLEECKGVVEGTEQGEVVLFLVGKKLPRRELLFLLLVNTDVLPSGIEQEAPAALSLGGRRAHKRIGLLEVFGGPVGWADNLLEKGEDNAPAVRIV
ncbi:heterokaryon incompatibility protein-domain-containing protein [Cladorrhinum sp. PSN332]|nr:heterokaryon incompatibility protein-domain-containing protein [Cladorrhinum sp. PSN332]